MMITNGGGNVNNFSQSKFISEFNDKHRERFNDYFFTHDDNDIIGYLKDMILSCQRNKFFTVTVEKFEIIDDYATVQRLLSPSKDSVPEIAIKDSDLKILKVTYYVEINGQSDNIDALIAVPRIINGSYIRLNGNNYLPLYQLVDGSTYNNTAAANAKTQTITMKTNFGAIKIVRNFESFTNTKDEEVRLTIMSVYLFSKKINVFEYYFARFGFYKTLAYFRFDDLVNITRTDPNDPDMYTFHVVTNRKDDVFISCPKFVFDQERVLQTAIACLITTIKDTAFKFTIEDLYTTVFWVKILGSNFVKSASIIEKKGYYIIESLEHVYDLSIKKVLKLPENKKKDIYCILKWLVTEFSNIRLKDNHNTVTKRIRWGEWLASLYIMQLNRNIFRVSEMRKNEKHGVKKLRQAIAINPMQLITEIQRSNLKGFRNMVNDRDSFAMLKHTIKGPSGPGSSTGANRFGSEASGGGNNISKALRAVDISHLGIVDVNMSSASDPGVGSIFCPLNKNIYNGYFTDEPEPDVWDESFSELLNDYRKLKSLKSVLAVGDKVGLVNRNHMTPDEIYNELFHMGKIIAKVATSKGYVEETNNNDIVIDMTEER